MNRGGDTVVMSALCIPRRKPDREAQARVTVLHVKEKVVDALQMKLLILMKMKENE